jgi:addiction module HigA family antidote
MIGSFRHKGPAEIYFTGKTHRIGAQFVRKCVRILQSLEVATQPEEMNVAGYRFHRLHGSPERWSVRVSGNYRITFPGQAKTRRMSTLRITIRRETMDRKNKLPPVHPGEILREDILPEVGLSVTATAKALGVSRQMMHEILAERRPLSAIMCLRVSRLLGSTPEFWMRLQAEYDLKKTAQDKKVMQRVAQIVPLKPQQEIHA